MNTPLRLIAASFLPVFAMAPVARAQETKPATPSSSPAPAAPAPALKAGDKAPPIAVESFLKGDPIPAFKKGQIYVLEFWATWCGPCIMAMPHLSELQAHYKDKNVTVVGVNVWEDQEYNADTAAKVRTFLEKQGAAMAYTVAYDGPARVMDATWMRAAERRGIPSSFVVDGSGTIAWIGHPAALDFVLDEVVKGTWDVVEGPRKMQAGRDAVLAACEKYKESYEAGEAAWAAAVKDYPTIASAQAGKRYADMLAAGHCDQAYALARTMFADAKAKKNSSALMELVIPMMNREQPPKVIDRQLALDVGEAVFALGDPKEPNRHVAMVQIHLLLGNAEEARKHSDLAMELASEEVKPSLRRWLRQMEDQAAKK